MPNDLTRREIEELAARCRKAIAPLPYQERRLQPVLRCDRPLRFAAVEVSGQTLSALHDMIPSPGPVMPWRGLLGDLQACHDQEALASWPAAQVLELCEAALELPGSKCSQCEDSSRECLVCSTCTPRRPGSDVPGILANPWPKKPMVKLGDQADALSVAVQEVDAAIARHAPPQVKPRTYDPSNLHVELGGIAWPLRNAAADAPRGTQPETMIVVDPAEHAVMDAAARQLLIDRCGSLLSARLGWPSKATVEAGNEHAINGKRVPPALVEELCAPGIRERKARARRPGAFNVIQSADRATWWSIPSDTAARLRSFANRAKCLSAQVLCLLDVEPDSPF